jgi:hypothetical protein
MTTARLAGLPPPPGGVVGIDSADVSRDIMAWPNEEEERHETVTSEEMARTIQFILQQQARLTATVGQLSEKLDRTADGIAALLAVAEIHDREITATNEKLDALISTVERYISEGREGKG